MPFVPYTNGIVSYSEISSASRGAYRPTWELLYAHYAQIKGVDAPWTEQYKDYTVRSMGGFEGGTGSWGEGSGHYDGLGWGSLLHHLDADDVSDLSRTSTSTFPLPTSTASASPSDLTPSPSSFIVSSTSTVAPNSESSIGRLSSGIVFTSTADSVVSFPSATIPMSNAHTPLTTSKVHSSTKAHPQHTVYVYSCE